MQSTVEVRFKGIRREAYHWTGTEEPLRLQDPVIVEAERGLDFGRVSAVGDTAQKKCGGCSTCGPEPSADAPADAPVDAPVHPPTHRAIVRRASQNDIRQMNDLRRMEDDIRREVAKKVDAHGLAMRISDAEWQWDRKKLTIYFTAEARVDFRTLVKELATQYRTRIDLRQIGVRDEAARLGGVGRCGREFCCSTWLKDLSPISLSLAKDQHLSLNPAQISGGCGRLLCCLRYEHEFYVASRKRFPKEGKTFRTLVGPEKVLAVDIFRERVLLRGDQHGHRTVPLADFRAEVEQAQATVETVAVAAESPPTAPRRERERRDRPDNRRPPTTAPDRPEPRAEAPATEAAPGDPPTRKRRRRRRPKRGGSNPPGTPPTPEA